MLTIYVPQNVHPIIEYSEPYTYVTISIETHEQSLKHEKKYRVSQSPILMSRTGKEFRTICFSKSS